jgi:hypothetical protein
LKPSVITSNTFLFSCPANIVTSLSPCLPAASRREGEGKKDIQKAAFGTKADVWW